LLLTLRTTKLECFFLSNSKSFQPSGSRHLEQRTSAQVGKLLFRLGWKCLPIKQSSLYYPSVSDEKILILQYFNLPPVLYNFFGGNLRHNSSTYHRMLWYVPIVIIYDKKLLCDIVLYCLSNFAVFFNLNCYIRL
jgi:hypothetical protein